VVVLGGRTTATGAADGNHSTWVDGLPPNSGGSTPVPGGLVNGSLGAFKSLKPVIGETSLIVSDGPDHKRRRGLVQPALHHKQVNGYHEMMAADADRLIDGWVSGQQVDLAKELQLVFRRMSVQSLFGERIGAQADAFGEQLQPMLDLVNQVPAVLNMHRKLKTTTWRRAMSGKRANRRAGARRDRPVA
jgi:cytochrome P450